ncbi:MAG: hypothetical protein QM784_32215 [Polyangiaceae bacterium]
MSKRSSLLALGFSLATSVAHAEEPPPTGESASLPQGRAQEPPPTDRSGGQVATEHPRDTQTTGGVTADAATRDGTREDIPSSPPNQPSPEATQPSKERDSTSMSHSQDEIGAIDGDDSRGHTAEGRFRILLQLRYRHTIADQSMLSDQSEIEREQRGTLQAQDGYDIQRAFLRYTARPMDAIETKLLVDFAELRHGQPRQSFKLAYLQIHATNRLEFDVGLMKRTYSLLELLPIVNHELADLGPTDSFIKDEGYGGRDVGTIVRYSPLPKRRWLTLSVGAFRGDIDEGYDADPLKLVTARIESFPWKHLRLGACGSYRPEKSVEMQRLTNADTGAKYYAEVTTLDPGKAMALDATLLFKHVQLRTEVLYGDRTNPKRVGSDHFAAGYVVLASRFKLGGLTFVPAGKVERLDLNPESSGGARTLMTAVVGVVPLDGLRILGDLTYTRVDQGLTFMERVPWTSSKNAVYAIEPSSTAITVQLQYHH